MNQYYQDNMLFGMNPSGYLHRYAVNGKVSGNLACISEIKNAAIVLYSPRGCGFHYRCHVRSGQSPVYELECADLRNKRTNCIYFYLYLNNNSNVAYEIKLNVICF